MPLNNGLKEYREKVKAGKIKPTKAKNPMEKWKDNPKSLRLSINAHCYECVSEDIKEVRMCTAKSCPLYQVRPYQTKGD